MDNVFLTLKKPYTIHFNLLSNFLYYMIFTFITNISLLSFTCHSMLVFKHHCSYSVPVFFLFIFRLFMFINIYFLSLGILSSFSHSFIINFYDSTALFLFYGDLIFVVAQHQSSLPLEQVFKDSTCSPQTLLHPLCATWLCWVCVKGLVRTIVVACLGRAVPTPTVIVVEVAAPITLAAPVAVVITRVWEVNIYGLIIILNTFMETISPFKRKRGVDVF